MREYDHDMQKFLNNNIIILCCMNVEQQEEALDQGRRVSFERECSSKAAAVLEQMKELLRRTGQKDDVEVILVCVCVCVCVREREREREREEWTCVLKTVVHVCLKCLITLYVYISCRESGKHR